MSAAYERVLHVIRKRSPLLGFQRQEQKKLLSGGTLYPQADHHVRQLFIPDEACHFFDHQRCPAEGAVSLIPPASCVRDSHEAPRSLLC